MQTVEIWHSIQWK